MKGIGSTAWQTERAANELARFARGFDGIDPTGTPIEVELEYGRVTVRFLGVKSWTGNDVQIEAVVFPSEKDGGVVYRRRNWDGGGAGYSPWRTGDSLNEEGEVG